jgi:hypothetical protein
MRGRGLKASPMHGTRTERPKNRRVGTLDQNGARGAPSFSPYPRIGVVRLHVTGPIAGR